MVVVTIGSILFNGLASYVIVAKFSISNQQMRILLSMFIGDALAPAMSYPLVVYASFKKYWDLGAIACSYYAFVTSVGGIASIYHLVLLSAERYFYVVHPYSYEHFVSNRNVKIALLVSWTLPVVTSSLPLLGWSSYVIEGIGTACAFNLFPRNWSDRSFNIYLVCTAFVVPMIFIVYVNAVFLSVVFKLVRCPCESNNSRRQSGEHDPFCQVNMDRPLAKQMSALVLLLILCFLLSWLPYACVAIIGILGKLPHDSHVKISIPSFFAKGYSLYDPIVYFFLDKKFRNSTISMVCKSHDVNGMNDIELQQNITPMINHESTPSK